jgi:eukaryotic-like serine/threonine-protein kinase
MEKGYVIADRFVIECLAGSGGMGHVFRAIDRTTQNPVAIKVLQRHEDSDVSRFLREARILSEIKNSRIVKYVTQGALPGGELYLAMEWLEGEDLATRLAHSRLTFEESVEVSIAIAEALGALHERGIVHRDLKPSNVFLVGQDVSDVRILDLGIARVASSSRHTTTGTMLGTVTYMAPEQARGLTNLDARADVFALGCLLFELVAGTPPFTGMQALTILTQILFEPAPKLESFVPDVPPDLAAFVARMLEKDPVARPEDGRAVADSLLQIRTNLRHRGSTMPSLVPASPLVLSREEMRPVAMLLVSAPLGGSDEADELAALATEWEAQFDRLLDGSATIMITGPQSVLDLTVRAAYCALQARTRMRGRRICISTGYRSDTGHLDIGAAFDTTVGLLTRDTDSLRALEPTQIVIDASAVGLLDVRFELMKQGNLVFLGQERPVLEPRAIHGKVPPFLGREREVRSLETLLRDCHEQSGAQVALVTASSGAGKTRFAFEFVRNLRAREEEASVWITRSTSPRSGSPGSLLVNILRAAGPEVRNEPELAKVLDDCHEGAIASPSDAACDAFVDYVTRTCRQAPLVIVLDDLQWADAFSIRLLDRVIVGVEDLPLLLIALARPEVHEVFPSLWKGRPLQEIRLREMPKRATERLIQGILGTSASPEVVDRLITLSDGNMFFLEEFLSSLEGDIDVERLLRNNQIPNAIVALTQSRLHDLHERSRRVLRAGSVMGMQCWGGAIAALLGHGGSVATYVKEQLDALVTQEILIKAKESTIPNEEEYSFRHIALQKAAYSMLTLDDRTLGHRLAKTWVTEHSSRDLDANHERGIC